MTDELSEARKRRATRHQELIDQLRQIAGSADPVLKTAARRALLDVGIPLTPAELPDDELAAMTPEQLRELVGDFVDHSRSAD
jgi:hypothetical protein